MTNERQGDENEPTKATEPETADEALCETEPCISVAPRTALSIDDDWN